METTSTTVPFRSVPLPVSHILLMCFGYTSLFLYVWIIFVIIKYRKKRTQLQSVFYDLVLNQAIADIGLFVVLEIIFRPRKYRFFDISLFSEQGNTVFVRFSYFSSQTTRSAMFVAHVSFALNRFTIFYRPTLYAKIWTRKTAAICLFIELAYPAACCVFLSMTQSFIMFFKLQPNGILQLGVDGRTAQVGASISIGTTIFVLILCSILYIWTFILARKHTLPAHMADNEFRYLICAFIAFLPLFLDVIRNVVHLIFAFSPDVFEIIADLFYFTSILACMSHPWTLLVTNKLIRKLLWDRSSSSSTTTTMVVAPFSLSSLFNAHHGAVGPQNEGNLQMH